MLSFTVGAVDLNRVSQCPLIGDQRIGIIKEEDEMIATWVGSVHLNVIVKLF